MKRIGMLIGFFALTIILLPPGTAQDVKKDDVKKEDKADAKKDDAKKDDAKKDDPKKDDPKKDDEKKPEKKPAPEKLLFSKKFVTKIVSVGANSSREFTVETYEPDPKKLQDYNVWLLQRQQALAQQQFSALTQKDFKARANALASYQKAAYQFEIEKAQKGGVNLMSVKPIELRAAENAKVRSLFPPIEFDELGFQKKWTKKELDERRDKSGLPGFPVEFDAIKSGQQVEIYLSKPAPMPKGAPKKKGPDDDDPGAPKGQEFILVIIRQDAGK